MPHLVDLHDQPLDWATLLERNEAYWRMREDKERFEPVPMVRFNGGLWRVRDFSAERRNRLSMVKSR